MEKLVLPHNLTTLNGCVVDLESEIGDLQLIRGAKRSAAVSSVTARRLPEIVIYEHIDFGGASERTNLNWYYVGDWWNDTISSIVIASGVWQFFQHWHYEEMARRGKELYESGIRQQVEAGNEGKIIAIDIETGEFEVDENLVPATNRLFERHPDAQPRVIRIGHRTVDHFGARSLKKNL